MTSRCRSESGAVMKRIARSQIAIDLCAFAFGLLLTSGLIYMNWGFFLVLYSRLINRISLLVTCCG
jgi:hypothetical protein